MTEHKSKMPPKSSNGSDIFYTPDSAIEPLLDIIPKDKVIWECAQGAGYMVDFFIKHGYECHGTDLTAGFDFLDPLASALAPDFDVIVTNPPYSLKDKWLQRCYDIGKPFALLLPIAALGEQARVKMYKKHGIQLLLPPERINFVPPSGEGGGAWQFHAWFTWGLGFERDINFV